MKKSFLTFPPGVPIILKQQPSVEAQTQFPETPETGQLKTS
jgi:hypothetical protein